MLDSGIFAPVAVERPELRACDGLLGGGVHSAVAVDLLSVGRRPKKSAIPQNKGPALGVLLLRSHLELKIKREHALISKAHKT